MHYVIVAVVIIIVVVIAFNTEVVYETFANQALSNNLANFYNTIVNTRNSQLQIAKSKQEILNNINELEIRVHQTNDNIVDIVDNINKEEYTQTTDFTEHIKLIDNALIEKSIPKYSRERILTRHYKKILEDRKIQAEQFKDSILNPKPNPQIIPPQEYITLYFNTPDNNERLLVEQSIEQNVTQPKSIPVYVNDAQSVHDLNIGDNVHKTAVNILKSMSTHDKQAAVDAVIEIAPNVSKYSLKTIRFNSLTLYDYVAAVGSELIINPDLNIPIKEAIDGWIEHGTGICTQGKVVKLMTALTGMSKHCNDIILLEQLKQDILDSANKYYSDETLSTESKKLQFIKEVDTLYKPHYVNRNLVNRYESIVKDCLLVLDD